jgi:hypothetical protein
MKQTTFMVEELSDLIRSPRLSSIQNILAYSRSIKIVKTSIIGDVKLSIN